MTEQAKYRRGDRILVEMNVGSDNGSTIDVMTGNDLAVYTSGKICVNKTAIHSIKSAVLHVGDKVTFANESCGVVMALVGDKAWVKSGSADGIWMLSSLTRVLT